MHAPNWCRRLWPYLGRRQAEEDLQEELRLHLELERERLRDAGVPEAEASRAARRKLGNAPLIRERTRDVWGWRWLDDLGRDVRHAARGLRRELGFTATVVCLLALGIGANTAMFSIVYGVLLRPLPYPDSEAIVRVGEMREMQSRASVLLTNTTMPQIQEDAESFEQLAAYQDSSVDWASPDGTVTLNGATVSPSLFPLLRATPHLGRLFTEEEALTGADTVVLLSHGAWTRRFGSDPDIVGTVLEIDDRSRTVVGVLAEGFYFPSPEVELWTPFVILPFAQPDPVGQAQPGAADRGPRSPRSVVITSFTALGRLRPGVSPEQAATEVRTILQRGDDDFARNFERRMLESRTGRPSGDTPEIDARVIPLREEMVGEYRPALLALTAATALVLLIACINVAGLLLARGVTRQRGLAVCAALGAGRGRIMGQLLTESVVLSLSGGVIGLAVATVVLRTVPALVPGDIARLDEVGVDGVVLAFTLGVSVVVGLAFGAVPAFQWSRLKLVRILNEGSVQSASGFRLLRSNRTRALLATAQVALALVLLVGAGLLLRSFVELLTVDRGYDSANVITAHTRNRDAEYRGGQMTPGGMDDLRSGSRRFVEALLVQEERLANLPGVVAVGLSAGLPLATTGGTFMAVQVDGCPAPSDPSEAPRALIRMASPGYFDVMRLRLRSGRFFTRLDRAGGPRVVVVNEAFARDVFGAEPAVGQRVWVGPPPMSLNRGLRGAPGVGQRLGLGNLFGDPWEVVGVVADIRYGGLTGTEAPPEAFVSAHQLEAAPIFGFTPFIAVRTSSDPRAIVPFLREAVAEAHPRATIDDVMTMDARLSAAVAQPRFYAGFVGFFAALALFLAAFGIYGLLSYIVAQRRREIGVRMALGAQRGDILALVVRQGAALVAAGAVVGLLAAAVSSRVLESFLYGVTADDRLTFVGAPLVLIVVALVACWLPARRATRIDPMDALRVE